MCATRAFIDMEQSPDLEPRQQAAQLLPIEHTIWMPHS